MLGVIQSGYFAWKDRPASGRLRTARLMRENDLRSRQKRRFKRTTDSEHNWPIAPNIIGQDFPAMTPNQKWGVDISYVWTREGWLYLTVLPPGSEVRAG